MSRTRLSVLSRVRAAWPLVLLVGFGVFLGWQPAATALAGAVEQASGPETVFRFFAPFSDPRFSRTELVVAAAGARRRGGQPVLRARAGPSGQARADQGTTKMQEMAAASAKAPTRTSPRSSAGSAPLIVLITLLLALTYTGHEEAFRWGRAGAFLVGALFSWTVGFVGMRLATTGNLRVAAAAVQQLRRGHAARLPHRHVTGMLTDGLGLLGGTIIFLIYGEQAYEALLGFGFGGTLLALFMRVGGGIYTKAADVGADLVGKIEKDIPEDDPRNAATIADNVGDNVGDCAGMAADIFESYEVTIVAAMILGMASFGHKGVIFPLLVRGIGVLGSIISTYTVKAGPNDTSDTALQERAPRLLDRLGHQHRRVLRARLLSTCSSTPPYLADQPDGRGRASRAATRRRCRCWAELRHRRASTCGRRSTCLIGVFLAVALNKVTSYYTHTAHAPVKSLAKACQTGHATNIIQGFARRLREHRGRHRS